MNISIDQFLNLKFNHEYHEVHREGSKCIYQDLIKNNKSIKEIIFTVMSDPEYLNIEKYETKFFLKYDHMKHYIYCILHGFRKDIIDWREPDSKFELSDEKYYLSKEKMDDDEIEDFLLKNKIIIDKNKIYDGFHRCFCMIGRIMRGEKYIPLYADTSIGIRFNNFILHKFKRPKIKNVGYRTRDNLSRLKLIKQNISTSNFTLMDIGSNFGYFSLGLSVEYPNSTIYSIEGSFGTGNEDVYETCKSDVVNSTGITTHKLLKNKYWVFNNHIFCMLMTKDTIESLLRNDIRFDYQLSLSVFHWIAYERFGNNGEPADLYKLLIDHLALAGTTFIELPDIRQENSLSPIYKNHDSIDDLFRYLKCTYKFDIKISILGKHKWYGTRYLFKIVSKQPSHHKLEKDKLIKICKPIHVY